VFSVTKVAAAPRRRSCVRRAPAVTPCRPKGRDDGAAGGSAERKRSRARPRVSAGQPGRLAIPSQNQWPLTATADKAKMHSVWNRTAKRYADGIYDGTNVKSCLFKCLIAPNNPVGMGFRPRHDLPYHMTVRRFSQTTAYLAVTLSGPWPQGRQRILPIRNARANEKPYKLDVTGELFLLMLTQPSGGKLWLPQVTDRGQRGAGPLKAGFLLVLKSQ